MIFENTSKWKQTQCWLNGLETETSTLILFLPKKNGNL